MPWSVASWPVVGIFLGPTPAALEDGDHGVGEAVIGLDRGVDRRVGGVRLLEDRAALGVVPSGGDLLADERHAGAVGGAGRRPAAFVWPQITEL